MLREPARIWKPAAPGTEANPWSKTSRKKRARTARAEAKRSTADGDDADLCDPADDHWDWDPYDTEDSDDSDQQEHMNLDGHLTSRVDNPRQSGQDSSRRQHELSSSNSEPQPRQPHQQMAVMSNGSQHHISPGSEAATCNWIQAQ